MVFDNIFCSILLLFLKKNHNAKICLDGRAEVLGLRFWAIYSYKLKHWSARKIRFTTIMFLSNASQYNSFKDTITTFSIVQ